MINIRATIQSFLCDLGKIELNGLTVDNVTDYLKKELDATLEKCQTDVQSKLHYKGLDATTLLAERLESFDKFKRDLGDKLAVFYRIDSLCQREIQNLIENEISDASLNPYVTYYRRAIREELGAGHPAIKIIRSGGARVSKYRDEYRKKVVARADRLFPASEIDKHIARAKVLCQHGGYYAKVAGIVALTGRRPIEIQLTGSFAPSPRGTDYAIFSGQAKTKGSPTARDTFEIPLLCDFEFVKSTLDAIRKQKDFNAGDKFREELKQGRILSQLVHDATSTNINNIAKYGTKRDGLEGLYLTCYDTRALYCAIESYIFKPENEMSFYSAILGHAAGDDDMQRMYRKFRVIENDVSRSEWAVESKGKEVVDLLEKPAEVEVAKVEVAKETGSKVVATTRKLPSLPRLVKPYLLT